MDIKIVGVGKVKGLVLRITEDGDIEFDCCQVYQSPIANQGTMVKIGSGGEHVPPTHEEAMDAVRAAQR